MKNWTNLTRVTSSTTPLLDLDTTKNYLRASDDDDDLISGLIDAATSFIEGPTGIGRALLTSTWRQSFDSLPSSLSIALGPVQTVDQITVLTDAGAVDVDLANVHVDTDQSPALIAFFSTRPIAKSVPGAVKVTFTAGYGDEPASVPADLRHAALWLVANWLENRGDDASKAVIPASVDRVLNKYRLF